MKIKLGMGILLCAMSVNSFSAKLCASISTGTGWDGGVFSVLTEDGYTIATTAFMATGTQGCTDSFLPGRYLVRFTGGMLNKTFSFGDAPYGCITGSYQFDDTVLNVVFNDGQPPFNGNSFCYPKS